MNTVSLRHHPPAALAHTTPPECGSCARRVDALMDARTFTLDVVDSCTSTNTVALQRAPSEPSAFAVATFDQRAGRGRQGRSWHNRPGKSLALSVCITPQLPQQNWPWYSLATALACTDLVRGADMKWPNDVIDREGNKIAGILCEIAPPRLVIGIGVNLHGPLEPTESLARAATAASLGGELATRMRSARGRIAFTHALTQSILTNVARLECPGGCGEQLKQRYAVNCITVGRDVWVHEVPTGVLEPAEAYTAEAISPHGHLVVRDAAGQRRHLSAADVHLQAPPATPRTYEHAEERNA